MKNIILLLFIFVSYFNAMAQKKTTTKTDIKTVTKAVASYKYIDGSNNTYIINAKNVEYVPITPENSSSGMYSGGKPFNVAISAEQATEITNLLAAAIKNQDIQLENQQETRSKGSGTIIKIGFEAVQIIILKMNAPEKLAIEKWLKALN